MTDSDTQRFNLVFSGQLLPDTDDDRAKRTLAAFFGLRDISGVAVFFSGKPVPLRRNLTRTDAQRLYRQLRSVGLICEITPVAPPSRPAAPKVEDPAGPELDSQPAVLRKEPSTKPQQGKAPNLFALRPAFFTQPTTQLRETAQIRSFIALGIALALCAVVLAVALRFPAAPAGKEPVGPLAGISLPGNKLLLLVEGALLIHERSGLAGARVSAAELGFDRLAPPLWVMQSGDIILNAAKDEEALRLQRCSLDERSCYAFSPQQLESRVIAIASSLLGNTIFLLGADGRLWRSNSAGEIQSETTVQNPWGQPRVLSDGGLLLIPAGDAPMLGVYRPDMENFGQQLDALLVMPPPAVAAGQDRVRDIALGKESHWALMGGNEATPALFRFDQQWGSPSSVSLSQRFLKPYLITWRDKILIADPGQPRMLRLAKDGAPEAPFESSLLAEERKTWLETSRQRSLMRHLGIGLPLMLVVLCVMAALLYHSSYRALNTLPQQRSALLDPMPGGIHWLSTSTKADAAVRRIGLSLLMPIMLALVLLGAFSGWPAFFVLIPAGVGALYGWNKLREGCGGHLGLLEKHFIAVDYDGRYFYGERSALRGNAAIIIAPGVVLPISLPGLRNLDTQDIAAARYTDSKSSSATEILGTLWSLHHPWIHAALAISVGFVLSIGLMILTGYNLMNFSLAVAPA
ncbi:hypothetical protein [Congregibacter sp.]|uniref:hypothetical protein n=1 Tax=Congregibacter sp. TaxID=2744308 RepID=UPI003F6C9766